MMREDWETVKLGEFATHEKGKKPKNQQTEKNKIFEYPYVNIAAFEKGIIETYTDGEKCNFCYEDDLLMVWDGSRSGLVGKGVNGALGSTLVRINFPGIENDYAYYFLSSKYQEINTRGKGSGTPHVDPYLLWNYDFFICSLTEQRAIVAKTEELFSDLDKGIADLKKAQDQLKVYRQAVLKKAFEGELTKEWREQQTDLPTADELLEQIKEERQKHYEQQIENWKQAVKIWEEKGKEGKKPGKPKKIKPIEAWSEDEEKNLFKITREWKWIRLVETVFDTNDDIVDGPFGSNLKNSDFSEDGTVPVIGISNIDEGFKTKIRYVTQEKFLTISRSAVYPGNIIVAKIGSSYGKTGIYPEWMPVGLIPANLLRIRPSKHYDRSLLILYLKSLIFKRKLDKIMKSTAQPAYNVSAFKSLPVPFMSSQEQHQIVQEIESRLSVCDKLEQSITESLEKAKALRQSILKKAFEGTLLSVEEIAACKAAPDYEPASVLLEKIKAEKKKK